MGGYTPGPWEARGPNGKFRVTDWDVVNHSLSYYATVPVHVGGYVVAMVVDGDQDDELLEANARLIAAAPTLLEAAQRVTAAFRSLGESRSLIADFELHKECEAAMLALDAAISRATGEGE